MEQQLEAASTMPTPAAAAPRRRSRLALLRRSPGAIIGTVILIFWIFMAVFGTQVAPYGINEAEAGQVWKPPSANHIMGTDNLGRDIFSRLIIASQTMVVLPPLAVGLAVLAGTAIGLITGYQGGWFDEIVMRIIDAIMAFPMLMLYLIIVVAVGQSMVTVVVAVAVGTAPAISRLVRGLVLDLRNREFVSAARMRGESRFYILTREILPNIAGLILVDALVRIGYAAFAIGALGFLGLGVPPPNPDWGRMAAEGRQAIILTPSAALFPSLAIASIVIACNLISDGLTAAAKRDE